MKVGVISLGCDKNTVDTEYMLGYLSRGGYEIASSVDEAQVIIINTCAFIAAARNEAENTINEMTDYKHKGRVMKIIVTGCFPEKDVDVDFLDEFPYVDAVLGINNYPYICEIIRRIQKGERVNAIGEKLDASCGITRVLSTPGYYAYVKVADGCDNHCTYCTIPAIRGQYKSRAKEMIADEVLQLARNGVKEIILVAQDLTRYGIDLYGKFELVDLIKQISETDGIEWIRLLYCYPENVTDELISEIKTNPKLCKYIDIPLQHVDNTILKYMNRRTTYEDIDILLAKLKNNKIQVRSTFMVGFPFEDEDMFNNLTEFLKQGRILNAGFFAYSREEDTAAYRLRCQVSEEEKEERLKCVYEIQATTYEKNYSKTLGKTFKVICEGIDQEKQLYYGRTEFMLPDVDGKIYFSSRFTVKPGDFVNVSVTYYNGYDLFGESL